MAGLEGKTLAHYELRRLIGRGGMANVYEAYDSYFERIVAVKVFKRDDEEMLRRFIREARLMASLNNAHLVPIYDTGETSIDNVPWYYIVMPFIEGGTLRARIRRSPLSLAEACRCLQDIASALDYIHSHGIIHRDIKSSNVLLDNDGRCYLTDFGIARITSDATQLTSTGNVLGTVDYVAPELFEINRRADIRSDLYSLGVLLYEMITGQLPFSAENQLALVSMHINKRPPSPRSISAHISPQVERVILKTMEKRPENRYGSATELAEAFCRAVTGSADTAIAKSINKNSLHEKKHISPIVRPIIIPHADASYSQRLYENPTGIANPARLSSLPHPSEPAPLERDNLAHQAFIGPQPGIGTISEAKGSTFPSFVSQAAPEATSRRSWLIALLALLLLLLVTIPLVYLLFPHGNNVNSSLGERGNGVANGKSTTAPRATPNLTATTQAALAATATAQTQATATAIAAVTVTAEAQASATAGVISTATAGKPIYQDALNNANNASTVAADWDSNDSCSFASDGYHDKSSPGLINLNGCHESNDTYSNAAITVDIRLISGHSGGLFFRLNTDLFNNYSGYLFEIDSTGNYKISNFHNNVTPLQNWAASPALKKGNNVTNTLQVIAQGSTLFFYANGVFLIQLTDSTYTSGTIGFLATSTDSDADIVYSNLHVYPLS